MCTREELMTNHKDYEIGLDEPFKFHCNQCGKCCINREDIILNARDIFNIAKKLKLEPQQFLHEYCDAYIGEDSRMLIVRLKPQGHVKRCPLLKDRKCSVHDVKPLICAMFPIGRVYRMEKAKDQPTGKCQISYIFTNPECGDDMEKHTVREWLANFRIPLEDSFSADWGQTFITLSEHLRNLESRISDDFMRTLWKAILISLYLSYDIQKDFLSQYQKNSRELLYLFQMISETNVFPEQENAK